MSIIRAVRVAAVLVVILVLVGCGDGPTAPRGPYRLTILPAFGTPSSPLYAGLTYQSYAYDIDEAGNVVGMAERADVRDAYGAALWPASAGPPISIESNGDVLMAAFGENSRGQVVGVGRCGNTGNECLWNNGVLTDLGSLDYPPSLQGEPLAINDSGVAAGWAYAPPDGFDHAVLWRDGVVRDLGTLGGLQSEALSINKNGLIVGWSRIRRADSSLALNRHAFLWQNGTMIDLDPGKDEETIAYAINDSGEIVGRLGDIGTYKAIRWEKDTIVYLAGTEPSQAFSVNSAGDIVGTYIVTGTTFHAALWRGGTRYDLSDLVGDTNVVLEWANAINDKGEIVGIALGRDQREVAFMLTPAR